jgi:hypothetical protein
MWLALRNAAKKIFAACEQFGMLHQMPISIAWFRFLPRFL